ncbi:MAG: HupE/UreJ family protein, partial [Acidobacteriota bacterium]
MLPKYTPSRSSAYQSGLLALLFFAGLLTPAALAHPAPFSYLDLRLSVTELQGSLVISLSDLARVLRVSPDEALLDTGLVESKRPEIQKLLNSRLRLIADGNPLNLGVLRIEALPERQALAFHFSVLQVALPSVIRIECALFPDDEEHQTLTGIYENGQLAHQELFNIQRTRLDYSPGGPQGTLGVVQKFIRSGIYHILSGADHILFLIGLLLLGGRLWRLLTIVTAFTLAHSITLSLAALSVINPPERLIESAIALSIIFVGVDNLVIGREGRDLRVWIAFFFGLIHGFGFAGVLGESGLPRHALAWSLFSFNLGVEIGQACIVVALASLLAVVHRRSPELGKRIAKVGSAVVILA